MNVKQTVIVFSTTLSLFISVVCPLAAKEAPLETIRLQLKWHHQFQFAGYYAAKAKGFYKEQGLNVEFIEFKTEKPVYKQVLEQKAEYGIADIGLLLHYAQGKPLKALAAIFQHNPLIFISKQSSNILSPYEMQGKRIMLEASLADNAPISAMMSEAGLTSKDYLSYDHSYHLDDFINGKVDVISGYISNEPFLLRNKNIEINIIKPQNYGVDFYGDIIFTSEYELEHHPDRAKRFLAATIKGWKYALKNPEELIRLIQSQYAGISSLEKLNYEANIIKKLVLPETIPIGQIKINRLKQVAYVYHQLGLIGNLSDEKLNNFIHTFKESAPLVDLTPEEQQWLIENPIIRLGIDANFPPYEWIDAEGNYKGIAADYIELLSKRLGIKFEISDKSQNWNKTLSAARHGKLDMLSCLVKTEQRSRFLNFTSPYLTSSAVIINEQANGYMSTLDKLNGQQVAIQKGHYTQELLIQNYPDIEITTTANIEEALRMVTDGRADAYVGDVTAASFIMRREGLLNLQFSGTTPYQSQFRFGIHKKNPILASIINKGINSISRAEREQIFNRWRAFTVKKGINPIVIVKYSLLTLIFFCLCAGWIYLLRKSERKLKASETKLQLIFDTAPECVKVMDAKGCLLDMNPTGLKTLGVDNLDQVKGLLIENFLLPEYRQAFRTMNSNVLQGKTESLEFEIKDNNGNIHWMHSHSVALHDIDNSRYNILSITRNITERKQNEEQLKLANLVYENTSEAIMVVDKENRIIATNSAFTEITGYTFNEVKDKNPSILSASRHQQKFYQEMWESIQRTGHWRGEIWNQKRNGELYAEMITINSIFDDKGQVTQRVALFTDITDKKETEKIIWEQANYDPLTQLPNRNMFMDRLNHHLEMGRRNNNLIALFFLDLDQFKEINDTLGHDQGDELLKQVAYRLNQCVRKADTIARLGGDEFVIILTELNGKSHIDNIAEKILLELNQPFKLAENSSQISCSIGISLFPDDSTNTDTLLKYADEAMYLDKTSGKNQYAYYTFSLQQKTRSRKKMVSELEIAVQNNQFELLFQPIYELETNQIVSAEALIRWQHPENGMLKPGEFISLAQSSGYIHEIGDWVVKKICQLLLLHNQQFTDLKICINFSTDQLKNKQVSQRFLTDMQAFNLDPNRIIIEINENTILENNPLVIDQLNRLKNAGVSISIDDFGTGYSALSYLQGFDIDYLKIDQSLVQNMKPGNHSMVLVEALILMSDKLGLKVIAEGIETEAQKNFLIEANCSLGQGHHYSKPLNALAFEEWLSTTSKKTPS